MSLCFLSRSFCTGLCATFGRLDREANVLPLPGACLLSKSPPVVGSVLRPGAVHLHDRLQAARHGFDDPRDVLVVHHARSFNLGSSCVANNAGSVPCRRSTVETWSQNGCGVFFWFVSVVFCAPLNEEASVSVAGHCSVLPHEAEKLP